MISKEVLTKVFLQQWGKSIDNANVELYSHQWWQSNRTNKKNAFRLSDEGFDFLVNTLELKPYEVPFTEPIELSPQTIIFLERYLDSPYYITKESITVFTERKSFELYMFSDDIRKFGLIKAMNEREKDLDSQKSD
jgi:hypothetical protein